MTRTMSQYPFPEHCNLCNGLFIPKHHGQKFCSSECFEKALKIMRNCRPDKEARRIHSKAGKLGMLPKKTHCQKCKRRMHFSSLIYHHPDYSKPTFVVVLCRKCHAEEHVRLRRGEKATWISPPAELLDMQERLTRSTILAEEKKRLEKHPHA